MEDLDLLDQWDVEPNCTEMTRRQACQTFYDRLPELVPIDFRYAPVRPQVTPVVAKGNWEIVHQPLCLNVASDDYNTAESWLLKCDWPEGAEFVWLVHLSENNTFSLKCANQTKPWLGGYMLSGTGHWDESQLFLKFDHVANARLKGAEATKWQEMRAAIVVKYRDLLDSKE